MRVNVLGPIRHWIGISMNIQEENSACYFRVQSERKQTLVQIQLCAGSSHDWFQPLIKCYLLLLYHKPRFTHNAVLYINMVLLKSTLWDAANLTLQTSRFSPEFQIPKMHSGDLGYCATLDKIVY